MPRVSASVMIQDFLKIDDPALFSVTKRDHQNGYDVSGEIFNNADQEATFEYQKIWYITKMLKDSAYASNYDVLAGLSRSTKKYKLIIPEHCLPMLDSEEDQALYRIKVLCFHYLIHVYEVIDESIRKYNQKLDKNKIELQRQIQECTFFILHRNNLSEKLKDLDAKYISNGCSKKRMQDIKEQIKRNFYAGGLWFKESAFCEMFHAKTIKEVAKIIKNHQLTLSSFRFRKTAIEAEDVFLVFFLKIMAIIITFPVSIPILAAASYKNRGTLCFYKPDSEVCVDKIQEEIKLVVNKA